MYKFILCIFIFSFYHCSVGNFSMLKKCEQKGEEKQGENLTIKEEGCSSTLPRWIFLKDILQERISCGYIEVCAAAYLNANQTLFFRHQIPSEGNENAIFEIGSLTKVFTAHLALLLEEEGVLSIDQPLKSYFPDGRFLPHDILESVTVRHLLTHTSGLKDPNTGTYYNRDNQNTVPLADFESKEFFSFLEQSKLNHPPGTCIEYSNAGYSLVSYLLEQLTGKDFFSLLKEKILMPLRMDSTYLHVPDSKKPLFVAGYSCGKQVPYWSIASFPGYAGLKSTVGDLEKYLRFCFLDQKQPRDLRIITQQITPFLKWDKEEISSGLGWTIDHRFGGHLYIMGGKTLGFSAFMGYDPIQKEALVLLTNSDELDNIGHHFFNSQFPLKPVYRSIDLPLSLLHRWTGKYLGVGSAEGLEVQIDKGPGFLEMQSEGEASLRLYPMEPDRFFIKSFYSDIGFIQFSQDDEGISQFHIIEDNNTLIFKKINEDK